MQPIADSFLVRPGRGSDVDVLRMRFGCDPALDACCVTGAGCALVAPHFNGLPPCLTSRLRASYAVALAILCGVSSRVAGPLQYESSHTRLLAITEEFEFHPGLPGWNFSIPNAGWVMRVRNVQWAPLRKEILCGAHYAGRFRPGAARSGRPRIWAPLWAKRPRWLRYRLARRPLGCLGYLDSAAFASGRRARRNRYTTKRN